MANEGKCDLGNTKTKSRIIPSKYWCFTLNNFTVEEKNEIMAIILRDKMLYIIGEEVGESGTPHLQGYIEWSKIFRAPECFHFTKRIHWEKRKGTREDNIKYCSKDGNFITNFKIPKKIEDKLLTYELYDYQKEVLDIIKNPIDDRKIYWYFSRDGDKGKTTLCKHICLNYNAIVLSGKGNDIKNGVATHLEKNKELDIAIFHFTRTVENFISYEAMEAIKDGLFFSGKYEASMCVFNSPHLFVFANFEPDQRSMSADRWIIKEIS